MKTVEISLYNKKHILVSKIVFTAEIKDIPARLRMAARSASNRNQTIQTRIIN